MFDIEKKSNNKYGTEGRLFAEEVNAVVEELEEIIKASNQTLNENDNKQLFKAVDLFVKHNYYTDVSTKANEVKLNRFGLYTSIEEYQDGITILFTPKNINTGPTRIKINNLAFKDLKYDNKHIFSNMLNPDTTYLAVYNILNDVFELKTMYSSSNIYVDEILNAMRNTFKSKDLLNYAYNIDGSDYRTALDTSATAGYYFISNDDYLVVSHYNSFINIKYDRMGKVIIYDKHGVKIKELINPNASTSLYSNGGFGACLALRGDKLLIGAAGEKSDARVWLYDITNDTFLLEISYPEAETGISVDTEYYSFGVNVMFSPDGNHIYSSSRGDVIADAAGSLLKFDLNGNYVGKISSPSPEPGREFSSFEIATSFTAGDYMIINDCGKAPRRIYVFDNNENVVATIESDIDEWSFGYPRSAFHNDFVYVPASNIGKVYKYNLSGELVYTFEHPELIADSGFGSGLIVNDDYIFIGANYEGVGTPQGEAFVYNHDHELVNHILPNNDVNYSFGRCLSVNNEYLYIGAPGNDITENGKIFMYNFNTLSMDARNTYLKIPYVFEEEKIITVEEAVKNFNKRIKDPEGLIRITEDGKTGWRLYGKDPNNYGPIGQDAVDLSISTEANTERGATGTGSLASGNEVIASGAYSLGIGHGVISKGVSAIAAGYICQAHGMASIAMGLGSYAGTNYSVGIGFSNFSHSVSGIAIGHQNTVHEGADYGLCLGTQSDTYGKFGVTIGRNSSSLLEGGVAIGGFVRSINKHQVVLGYGNEGEKLDTIFELGNGIENPDSPTGFLGTRRNAIEVFNDGVAVLPHTNIEDIELRGPKALITKEFAQQMIPVSRVNLIEQPSGSTSDIYTLNKVLNKDNPITGTLENYNPQPPIMLSSDKYLISSHYTYDYSTEVLNSGLIFIYDTNGNLIKELHNPHETTNPELIADVNFGKAIDLFGDLLLIGGNSRRTKEEASVWLYNIATDTFVQEIKVPITELGMETNTSDVLFGSNVKFSNTGTTVYVSILNIGTDTDNKGHLLKFDLNGNYIGILSAPYELSGTTFANTLLMNFAYYDSKDYMIVLQGEMHGSVALCVFDENENMVFSAEKPSGATYWGTFGVSIHNNILYISDIVTNKIYMYNLTTGVLIDTYTFPTQEQSIYFGVTLVVEDDYIMVSSMLSENTEQTTKGKIYIFDHSFNLLNTIIPTLDTAYAFGATFSKSNGKLYTSSAIIDNTLGGYVDINYIYDLNTGINKINIINVTESPTVKLIAQVKDTITGEIQSSELLVVSDGTTAFLTEYALIYTGANPLATYDAALENGIIQLLIDNITDNITEYKIVNISLI